MNFVLFSSGIILMIPIILFFLCLFIILIIKQRKTNIESIKIEEESKRLTKLIEEDKPYTDFTEGHLYQTETKHKETIKK